MTIEWESKPCVYNIPAGLSFVEVLAHGIRDMAGGDPFDMAKMEILLPTRRACRSLRDAFLKITEGKPLLLPRMHPIGDVDDEELSLLMPGIGDELSLPPAISPLRRQFLLSRLIGGMAQYSRGIEQDMMLAAALGRLMDQVYTEDLDLRNLSSLVDRAEFSEHWQISVDFLSILSEHWPRILKEQGVIDPADRRNRLLKRLSTFWRDHPPAHKIIAAGSTGSIPATAELLKTIAGLSHGCIVLPCLDQGMDDDSWNALEDTHPQATLRHLLSTLNLDRNAIRIWPYHHGDHVPSPTVQRLISEVMRPAETAGEWQRLKESFPLTKEDVRMRRYDCGHPQEEALVIALALRQSLETAKTSTAALVTPDRNLARRVAMICRRWGIEIDDSAGTPLSQTPVGTYLRLCVTVARDAMKPVSLLSFCKHTLCQPEGIHHWRSGIRTLDRTIMRGTHFKDGTDPYYTKMDTARQRGRSLGESTQILDFIAAAFSPLTDLLSDNSRQPFETWCAAHLEVAEHFSPADILWSGEEGDAASLFFSDLMEQASLLPGVTLDEYLAILEQTMAAASVRPAYGLHPRLRILGQLEARLVEADLMILSGLNENTWPPDAGSDPWMSRPMRQRFGLPPLERGVGLSAHDFAQAFCARAVIMTRAVRADGSPTVPSRWLQRLDTVLEAAGLDPALLRKGDLLSHARTIDHSAGFQPVERPKPAPPVNVRPRSLPVTDIERWMQDPYGIYAKRILRLKKLDPLEQPFDAAQRGTLIHTILRRFVERFHTDIPADAAKDFLIIAREEMEILSLPEDIRTLWRPRLEKIAGWLVETEQTWRSGFTPVQQEAEGSYSFAAMGGDFTLTARADRIDLSLDGREAAIIDYKSGGQFSGTKMKNGLLPQLPLEAYILETGGFSGVKQVPVTALSYWIVNGSGDGGDRTDFKALDIPAAIENARDGIRDLVETFDLPTTPYLSLPRPERAPRFNDYEYLARVKEWIALDDPGESA